LIKKKALFKTTVNVGPVTQAANHALELLRLIVMSVQMDFSKKN
jgi:hypothetical protein